MSKLKLMTAMDLVHDMILHDFPEAVAIAEGKDCTILYAGTRAAEKKMRARLNKLIASGDIQKVEVKYMGKVKPCAQA